MLAMVVLLKTLTQQISHRMHPESGPFCPLPPSSRGIRPLDEGYATRHGRTACVQLDHLR